MHCPAGVGLGPRSRTSPPGQIAYLELVAVLHRVAVEAGVGCALGNHRLRKRSRRDGQHDD